MAIAALTSKGQITGPKSIRKKLGLQTGDQVLFVEREDGEILVRAKKGNLMDFYGMFKGAGKSTTIEEMKQAIANHAVQEYLHGAASDEK